MKPSQKVRERQGGSFPPLSPMITLFFDATPLALWEEADIHKTGIGRMATRTLHALLQRADIRVFLVCPSGKEAFVLSFLEKNAWTSGAELAFSLPEKDNVFWTTSMLALLKNAARKFLAPMPSTMQAAVKRLAGVRPFAPYEKTDRALREAVISRIPTEGCAVWFSCFHPIPDAIANIQGLQRHVVIHDIIPLRLADKHPFSGPCRDLMEQHLKKADVIWANSEFTRRDFLDYFPDAPEKKVQVALHGGGEHFQPVGQEETAASLAPCGLPAGCPYFLSLATLEPRKGLLDVIRAFNEIAQRDDRVHLILVGQKGWDYQRILRECSHNERIHMPGFLPDASVSGLLSGCLGFLYMSEYEGFGLPVVEAMSCGAPVIAAKATSLIEVGADAVLFVDPGDIRALAKAMARLHGSPALRNALREKGLMRAMRFTWDNFAATIVTGMETPSSPQEGGTVATAHTPQ